MKKLQVIGMLVMLIAMSQQGDAQTTYTFSGSGNWTNAALWSPGLPPNTLPLGNTIIIDGDCLLDATRSIAAGAFFTVNAGRSFTVDAGSNFITAGTAQNDGTINNNNNFYNEGIFTNSASGSIVSGNSANDNFVNRLAATLLNEGDITVSDGNFTNRNILTNNGTFSVLTGADFNNAQDATLLTNNGTISVDGIFITRQPLLNTGQMTFSSASTLEIRNSQDMTNALTGDITLGGIVTIINGDLVNNGSLDILTSASVEIQGQDAIVTNLGATTVMNGDITVLNNGGIIGNLGSTIMGAGMIELQGNGFMTLDGALAPGNSIGTLTITGDIAFGITASLEIEINGTSGVNDVLAVSGDVDFAGTLNVSINGGTIDAGDSYNVVTYGSSSGTFTLVNLPGNNADWTTTYGPTALNLTYMGSAILPVTWLSFRAALNDGDKVELTWSTASESNNEGFDVQRSENGRDWQSIAFVQGAGTTSEVTNYSYTDNTLSTINSKLAYYRLEQRDYDGTTDYSPIRVVELSGGNAIRVFPNPADEAVTVAFAEPTEKRGTIQLFNQNGRLVAEEVVAPGTTEHTVRVAYLPAGTYALRVVAGAQAWTKRVVVE